MMSLDPHWPQVEHEYRTERLLRGRLARARTPAPHPGTQRQEQMNLDGAIARFEAALNQQVALAGDPAVESAAQALRSTLSPATRQLALELAEQAAAEVAGQLPDHQVDVVLREGEPALSVRAAEMQEAPASSEDLEARITLRLPPSLKERIEESAQAMGDSVNAFVIKSLAARAARPAAPGRRVTGTVRT